MSAYLTNIYLINKNSEAADKAKMCNRIVRTLLYASKRINDVMRLN